MEETHMGRRSGILKIVTRMNGRRRLGSSRTQAPAILEPKQAPKIWFPDDQWRGNPKLNISRQESKPRMKE